MGGASGGTAGNFGGTTVAAGGASGAGGTAPVVLASGKSIRAIAVDSTYVYWAGMDGIVSTIGRVPKAGGTPTTVYNSVSDPSLNMSAFGPVLVDSTSVYFNQSTYCGIANSFLKAAKDGSTATGAALTLAQNNSPHDLTDMAADSTTLYSETVNGDGIFGVSLAGGGQRTVVDPAGASPVDPGIGLAIGFPGISGVATDGTNLYYAAEYSSGPAMLAYKGWLLSVPVSGGTPTILVSAQKDVSDPSGDTSVIGLNQHLSVNGAFIYWSNGRSVYKVSVQGGAPIVLATNAGDLNVVSDGTNVYYTGSGLWRVPVGGGTSVKLVPDDQYAYGFGTGQPGGFPIAVDDTSVYIVASSLEQIIKVAK
jgi:hypothetical protein